jgi:hypothetical protein
MDALDIDRLIEDIIKDFEKSETHSILFYSQNQDRDFKLLINKVNNYRERKNKLLAKNGAEFNVGSNRVESGA